MLLCIINKRGRNMVQTDQAFQIKCTVNQQTCEIKHNTFSMKYLVFVEINQLIKNVRIQPITEHQDKILFWSSY